MPAHRIPKYHGGDWREVALPGTGGRRLRQHVAGGVCRCGRDDPGSAQRRPRAIHEESLDP